MPGLRSLVARRRCSLPTPHIAPSEQILYSYPSVAGTNTPRKRNSLDVQSRDVLIAKEGVAGVSKWDLKTVFEIKDENLASSKENNEREMVSYEETVCCNNDSNALGKENDDSFPECISNYYQNGIHAEKLEENCVDVKPRDNHNISPERIVIKMKLLHGNSLSDVTNLASEAAESSDNSIRDKLVYEPENNSNIAHTRWTIDSIMNGPVNNTSSTPDLDYFTESLPDYDLEESIPLKNLEINSPNLNKKNLNCNHPFEKPLNNLDNELPVFENCNIKISKSPNVTRLMTENGESLSLDKLDSKQTCSELNARSVKNPLSLENVRRSSDSSDISEESISSEVSTVSNSSSKSSVKSCSIVIKRLDNSDTYSCFRSPKNKKKRHQDMSINCESKKCIKTENSSLLYISKEIFIKPPKMENLPCSVILCDIFSNFPFTKMNCPHCFHLYNVERDLYVNIDLHTITLQCTYCNWLVVRKLQTKQINLKQTIN